MPLLNPQKDYVQWWVFELFASAGRYRQEIMLYKDHTVEIVHDSSAMVTGKERFFLSGEHEVLSDDYGWIHVDSIRKATDETLEQFTEINLRDFDKSLMFEYFRVSRAPHVQHPHDMVNVAARWTEHFDYLVILQRFTVEVIDALNYMIAHSSEYNEDDLPDPHTTEIVSELLYSFDRQKFKRVESA